MRLTMGEKRTVTKVLAEGYRKTRKLEKGKILDRVVEGTGYSRRYAAWMLRTQGQKVEGRPGKILMADVRARSSRRRPKWYGPETLVPLRELWALLDFPSGKRLVPAIREVIPILETCGEFRVEEDVRGKLMALSPATADRLLREEKRKYALKRRGLTKPGTLLKHQIPLRTFSDWDDAVPGFLEIDLVGHDGGDLHGDFCCTLDAVDVATGWTEQVAVRNKAEVWVFEAIGKVRARLPFPLLGLDSDNGAEFINHHLKKYCDEEEIHFTRSRPYRKNDTCHVEQKNWSVVRRFVGYRRYDSERQRSLLNALYDVLRCFTNFFLPTMRLKEKIRDGARVTRRYEAPVTPYRRVLASPHVSRETKDALERLYGSLNPAELRRTILALQKEILHVTDEKDKWKRKKQRAVEGAPPLGKPAGSTPAAFPVVGWKTPGASPRRRPEFPTPPTAPTAGT